MNNIHVIACKRLFLGWLTVSLLIGGGTWWYGVHQINQQALTLAETEVNRVASAVLKRVNGTPMDIMALQVMAGDYEARGFVSMELYNQHGQMVVHKAGVDGKRIESILSSRGSSPLPRGKGISGEHIQLGQSQIVRVLVPLIENNIVSGHFEGLYIVPEERIATLRQHTQQLLVTASLVVLLTTLLLYPFIFSLNKKVHIESHTILRGNMELMKVLGSAIAKRDSDTNSHNFRVTLYAARLAETIQMPKNHIKQLIAGAFLHDVGKIGIHDAILLKPGPLDKDEFAIMKQHVGLGLDIISHSNWLRHAYDVVANHHEWFDGSGYPKGLTGDQIPLTARVFSIADVFDALTSTRPYKAALPLEQSLHILQAGAGTHFEPRLVDAFIQIAPDLYQRFTQISDKELEKELEQVVLNYWNGLRE